MYKMGQFAEHHVMTHEWKKHNVGGETITSAKTALRKSNGEKQMKIREK